MSTYKINLKPSSIVRILGTIIALLVLASIITQTASLITGHKNIFGLVPLFNLNNEFNFPTYYSALQLIVASFLLMFITAMEKRRKAFYIKYWAFLSIIFLYLSCDELIILHERASIPMRDFLGSHLSIFNWAWIIPYGILTLILAVVYIKFLFNLPKNTGKTFIIAAVIYVSGAIIFDFIGSYYSKLHPDNNFIYVALTTVEEGLEMTGILVFIYGLLEYIAVNYQEFKITFN